MLSPLIHNLRKILIILINDPSDSNHSSSKFTVLAVVAFTKEENDKTASEANTQPSSKYCSVRMRLTHTYIILVNVDSWSIEINNIMCIVKYECDEYFER